MEKQKNNPSWSTQFYPSNVEELEQIKAEYGRLSKKCKVITENGPASTGRPDGKRKSAAQLEIDSSTDNRSPLTSLPLTKPVSREWELAVRFAIVAGFIFMLYSEPHGKDLPAGDPLPYKSAMVAAHNPAKRAVGGHGDSPSRFQDFHVVQISTIPLGRYDRSPLPHGHHSRLQ